MNDFDSRNKEYQYSDSNVELFPYDGTVLMDAWVQGDDLYLAIDGLIHPAIDQRPRFYTNDCLLIVRKARFLSENVNENWKKLEQPRVQGFMAKTEQKVYIPFDDLLQNPEMDVEELLYDLQENEFEISGYHDYPTGPEYIWASLRFQCEKIDCFWNEEEEEGEEGQEVRKEYDSDSNRSPGLGRFRERAFLKVLKDSGSWMVNPANRNDMPEELRDSRPLDSKSAEYRNSLDELIEYNKRALRRSRVFTGIISMPMLVLVFILLWGEMLHGGDMAFPFHTGIIGVIWYVCPIIISIVSCWLMCIFYQFDVPYPDKYIGWSQDNHNPKVFPGAIKPYLAQGTEAAWYFVHHRNDRTRKSTRFWALILIPVSLFALYSYAGAFQDLSNPPQSIQMQTEYSRLEYSEHYQMYVVSCDDELGNGHDFNLTKWEVEKMVEPLLPYFQYEGQNEKKNVSTWSEADAYLKAGNTLFLRNNPAEDGVNVFISMYPNSESLCGFVLASKVHKYGFVCNANILPSKCET